MPGVGSSYAEQKRFSLARDQRPSVASIKGDFCFRCGHLYKTSKMSRPVGGSLQGRRLCCRLVNLDIDFPRADGLLATRILDESMAHHLSGIQLALSLVSYTIFKRRKIAAQGLRLKIWLIRSSKGHANSRPTMKSPHHVPLLLPCLRTG